MFKVPNQYRIHSGPMGSDDSIGLRGAFLIPIRATGAKAYVVASNQMGWEHVSVTLKGKKRCPKWEEMNEIKRLFWHNEACVMQLHPPISSYINNHPYCLHLWRPIDTDIPMPPECMVGVKSR